MIIFWAVCLFVPLFTIFLVFVCLFVFCFQIQREARAERERLGEEWRPNFFSREENEEDGGRYEKWISNGSYWTHRENKFADIQLPTLW